MVRSGRATGGGGERFRRRGRLLLRVTEESSWNFTPRDRSLASSEIRRSAASRFARTCARAAPEKGKLEVSASNPDQGEASEDVEVSQYVSMMRGAVRVATDSMRFSVRSRL